jgi:hypothetical protein
VVHPLLGAWHEVYLYTQTQLHVARDLARLLERGEVYLVEVAIVLGYAHLADAPRSGNLAVLQNVLHGHRTVAVGYDVQVVVDQRLLSESGYVWPSHLIR